MNVNATETVLAQRVDKRKTRDGYLVATSMLHRHPGSQQPRFSVTAELWTSAGWYRDGQEEVKLLECGCLHERILQVFPELAPLVALHLSDHLGVPLHAFENAWTFYREGDLDLCARHLRIDVSEIPIDQEAQTFQVSRESFKRFVDAQRPRWAIEAKLGCGIIRRGERRPTTKEGT